MDPANAHCRSLTWCRVGPAQSVSTWGQVGPFMLVELLDAFGVPVRGVLRPPQPYRKVKSFTKKLSCCSRLSMHWQRWRHRSGWRSVVCVPPCTVGTDHGMQSQTQLVTWPTAWQQPTPTSVRSVLPPKLARSESQPVLSALFYCRFNVVFGL